MFTVIGIMFGGIILGYAIKNYRLKFLRLYHHYSNLGITFHPGYRSWKQPANNKRAGHFGT